MLVDSITGIWENRIVKGQKQLIIIKNMATKKKTTKKTKKSCGCCCGKK